MARPRKYEFVPEQVPVQQIAEFVRAAEHFCTSEKRKQPKNLLAALGLFAKNGIRDFVPWCDVQRALGWRGDDRGLNQRRATLVDELKQLSLEMCTILDWETQRPYNHFCLSVWTDRGSGLSVRRLSRYDGQDIGDVVRTALRQRLRGLTNRAVALNDRELRELGTIQQLVGDQGLPSMVGAYQIERELGRGTTGCVYVAQHAYTGRRVALKLMHSHLAHDRTQKDRFFRGATAMIELNHPNVVRILDVGDLHHGQPYYAAELIDGGTLADLIADKRPLSLKQACTVLGNVVAALAEAHRKGIVHRDVKPENILLDRNGEPKVTDFDCAFLPDLSTLTTALAGGTLHYMSPERRDDLSYRHPSDDVYAFGIIALELLTRRRFQPARQMLEELEPHQECRLVLELIKKCIMPAQLRYPSALPLQADWRAATESNLVAGATLPVWIDPVPTLYYADRWMPNQIFEKKYLARANFRSAQVAGSRFTRSVLSSAVMMGADLQGCCFDGALMIGARMQGSKVQGATFRMANLERTVWDDVDLAGVDLTGANLWGAFLERARNLDRAILEAANFSRNVTSPEQAVFLSQHPTITRADRYAPFFELARKRHPERLPEELWWSALVTEPDSMLMYY